MMEDQGGYVSASYESATLTVHGIGSVWNTQGVLIGRPLFGDTFIPTVRVLEGGIINSGQVVLSSQTASSALVDGVGSCWNISGDLIQTGNGAGGGSGF